jgi:hypothetical protein
MIMKSTLAQAVIVLAFATPVTAYADPKQDAEAHLAKAMEAHGQQNYERAVQELLAASAIDPNPDLLYAIGQVYVKLERCPDAITYYERYLETEPPAQAMVDTNAAIESCKAAAPPPAPEPPPPPPTPTPEPPRESPPIPNDTPPAQSPWYKDKLGGVLVGTGVVSSIIGVVMYSSAVSDLDAAEVAPSLDRYDELVDGARSKRMVSVVLIGGGVALFGAGVVRYVLRRDPGRESRNNVVVAPLEHGGLVTWMGRF